MRKLTKQTRQAILAGFFGSMNYRAEVYWDAMSKIISGEGMITCGDLDPNEIGVPVWPNKDESEADFKVRFEKERKEAVAKRKKRIDNFLKLLEQMEAAVFELPEVETYAEHKKKNGLFQGKSQ